MAQARTRKTEARGAERMRRRAARERRATIRGLLPFGILGAAALLVVGLALFGSLRTSGALDSPNAKPRFTVDTEKLELGEQELGKGIKASFNVKNTGDGRLTLSTPPMVKALEGC